MKYVIRAMNQADAPLLEEFLYQAIFVPAGEQPPPRTILDQPELRVYLDGFGSRPDDAGMLAEADGKAVGAIWARIMNDYGHIDDQTPSLAFAVDAGYRGLGIGTALMERLLALLRARGYARVSLAVQKANAAVRVYRRAGFEAVAENEQEYIMVCRLARP